METHAHTHMHTSLVHSVSVSHVHNYNKLLHSGDYTCACNNDKNISSVLWIKFLMLLVSFPFTVSDASSWHVFQLPRVCSFHFCRHFLKIYPATPQNIGKMIKPIAILKTMGIISVLLYPSYHF